MSVDDGVACERHVNIVGGERVQTHSLRMSCDRCGQNVRRRRPHQKFCSARCRLVAFKIRKARVFSAGETDPGRPD
jgi:hypothetical protein